MNSILKTFVLLFSLLSTTLFAQVANPVSWSSKLSVDKTVQLNFSAAIEDHWHLYSPELDEGGPIPTSLTLETSENFKVVGKLTTSKKPTVTYDSLFMMEILYFDHKVDFTQKIERLTNSAFELKGYIEYMSCDDSRCLPPESYEFSYTVPAVIVQLSAESGKNEDRALVDPVSSTLEPQQTVLPEQGNDSSSIIIQEQNPTDATTQIAPESTVDSEPVVENAQTSAYMFWIFIAGFLGGLLALLTPCVFPMVPMTVSVFMKMGGKGSGVKNALFYGASIIILYVSLGFAVTVIFGADALNALSTHPVFNIIFFLLLSVFAAAFLGAFEIQLPTSWANFFDSKADTSTGFVSILFMAFTLALVSFSCTGPIIGTLLVEAAVSGNSLAPLLGMFGFSLALALPFTLFAMFPSMLSTLPKSGGWLNSVKVVLGFLELAFAFKFLSTADLVMHWGILPRELFLAIWIVLFTLLGFYLLGKLRLSHDSPVESISVTRLLLATASLVFALWMVPGMWGAPLTPISAFPPPLASQEFVVGQGGHVQKTESTKKYSELFHCPNGLDCYFDLDEALAESKKVNKPVLIDFTGHGCVNCRKMEAAVLSDDAILKTLAEDYIVVSLYVDDRTKLPESEQYEVQIGETMKKIRTIGNKWSAYQTINYKTNSQPYYVVVDSNGKQLIPARAYDLNVADYLSFLTVGTEAYANK